MADPKDIIIYSPVPPVTAAPNGASKTLVRKVEDTTTATDSVVTEKT